MVGTKSQKEIMKKVQEIQKKKENIAEALKKKEAQLKAIAVMKETIAADMERQINKTPAAAQKQQPAAQELTVNKQSSGKPAAKESAPVDAGAWSEEQLRQLEASMKAVPSNLGTRVRWERIALAVEGKDQK